MVAFASVTLTFVTYVLAFATSVIAAPTADASDAAVMSENGSDTGPNADAASAPMFASGPGQEYDGFNPQGFYKRTYKNAHTGHHHITRRGGWGCGNCGGWGCGNCGGWGFPFAVNTANRFNNNAYAANYHDNTLYCNDKNAHVAANNVNACNSANIIV
ncbi:hypothetical protein IW150_003758 [Coemansia sp. RSA 2607]|nr:hypothetical protein IW150_003758 [Coemansia sp. RSA 2607]